MSDMRIIVIGPTACGKSTVARMIRDFLEERGLAVEVVDDGGDAARMSGFEAESSMLIMADRGTSVGIETVQASGKGKAVDTEQEEQASS